MLRDYADTWLGQMHYREQGTGEPLILLHQTADSGQMFTEVFPCLSERFRVIAPDTPGFGDSDKPSEPPGIEGYARALADFLDSLGIDRANVLGHHTGASIAVEFAATYPDRVIKLVLSGCPDYDPEVRPQKIATSAQPSPIDEGGEHLARAWARVSGGMKSWATLEQIHRSALDTLKAGPNFYYSYLAVFTQDVRTRIPKITAPTLLVSGENDIFVERQEQIRPMFKEAKTYVFKGAGALTMMERTDEFCRVVTDFLTT
ncbi:MAG: alpha/beta hydrolase [Dehalococcoidia bacterium]